MAKTYITHSCGHVQCHDLVGPGRDRERKETWLEGTLCSDCYGADLQRQRDEATSAAKEKAVEYAMPVLTGSPKQVEWANTIRMGAIAEAERNSDAFARRCLMHDRSERDAGEAFLKERDVTRDSVDAHLAALGDLAVALLYEEAAKFLTAREWIDNRDSPLRLVQKALCARVWTLLKALVDAPAVLAAQEASRMALQTEAREQALRDAEAAERKRLQREAEQEATLLVESSRSRFVALVEVSGNEVTIDYPERDDVLMNVAIEIGFRWTGSGRKLTCGSDVRDRASETVHRLLAAGFNVRCMDPDVRARGLAGEYKSKVVRIIERFSSGKYEGCFGVHWEKGGNLYDGVKRIRGTRWSRDHQCAAVRPEMWQELEDFAETHGFEFSAQARELLQERQAMDANPVTRVKPSASKAARKEMPGPGAIPPAIEVPVDVAVPEHLLSEL